jgi:hypothetical protein
VRINTYFIDSKTEIWFICEFCSIRSFRVEFIHVFPSNPKEYLAFREDLLDPLIISRSRIPIRFFIVVHLCSPLSHTTSIGIEAQVAFHEWGGVTVMQT